MPQITDEDVFEALYQALDDGRRDRLCGGVHPHVIAEYTDHLKNSVSTHVYQMVERGELVVVDGIAVDGTHSRQSVLPPDHPDADGPGEEYLTGGQA